MADFNPLKRAYGWLENQLWGATEYPQPQRINFTADTDIEVLEDCSNSVPGLFCQRPSTSDNSCTYLQSTDSIRGKSRRAAVRPAEIDSCQNSYPQKDATPSQPRFAPNGVNVATVNDNGVEVHALLLTSELIELLQDNVSALDRVDSLDQQVRYLGNSLNRASDELKDIEKQVESLQGMESKFDGEMEHSQEIESLINHKESLQQSISQLEEALSTYRLEQYSASSAKKAYEKTLFNLLQQPLRQSGLIPTEQAPSQTPKEESIPIQLDNESLGDHAHPVMIYTQGYTPTQTPSEVERMNFRVAIEEKSNKIAEYRHDLDTFPEIYAKNLNEFNDDVRNGTQEESMETFDQWHFNLKAEITRTLTKAEDELREFKMQAREAGVEPTYDEESIFQSHPNDGYAESLEMDMIRAAPAAKIDAWLDDISGEAYDTTVANSLPPLECDEWDSRTVEIGDSISCVGCESQNRKIQRWEEMKPRM